MAVTVGDIIRPVLELRGISANRLAQAIGVDDKTLYRILELGGQLGEKRPNGYILRDIAEFLGVDLFRLYEVVGYLPEGDRPAPADALTQKLETLIGQMSAEERSYLLDVAQAVVEKRSGPLTDYGKVVEDWIKRSQLIRKRHLSWIENLDLVLARLTHIKTPQLLRNGIRRRLEQVGIKTTPEEIERVAAHPLARIIMASLLDRRDLPGGLEKLYYLTYPAEDPVLMSDDTRSAVQDTWSLLLEAVATNVP